MGNSPTAALRSSITDGNVEELGRLLLDPRAQIYVDRPLNRKGDTPLILAARLSKTEIAQKLIDFGCDVHAVNRENNSALDVAITKALPGDGDILHLHSCPYTQGVHSFFQIPELVKVLLRLGCRGAGVDRLILHCMRNEDNLREIINLLGDMQRSDQLRVHSLLLQVTVWFEQSSNLQTMLLRGIDPQDFWRSSFMPQFSPSNYHRSVQLPRGEGGDYVIKPLPESDSIQTLKFSFVQDWRTDWNDGENPSAQYRAGLQLTPECAVVFIRAANDYCLLMRTMDDVLSYLPITCRGPDLEQRQLVHYFYLAGYRFTTDEMRHLQLKFNVFFDDYLALERQPKSLKHLCRLNIRFSFRRNVFAAVAELGSLPPGLRDYLTLKTHMDSF